MQRNAFRPYPPHPFAMFGMSPWRRGSRFSVIDIEDCAPNSTLVELFHSIYEDYLLLEEMVVSLKNDEWGSLDEKRYTRALENPPEYEDEAAVKNHMEILRRHAGRRISFLRARLVVEGALRELKKKVNDELKPHLDQMKPSFKTRDSINQKRSQSLMINYMMARRLIHTVSEFIQEQENFLGKTRDLSTALHETLEREFEKVDKHGSMDDKTFWTNLSR